MSVPAEHIARAIAGDSRLTEGEKAARIGELAVPSGQLFERLHDSGDARRSRRFFIAVTSVDAVQRIERAVGYKVRWISGGPSCGAD